jgi:hypothetical protein
MNAELSASRPESQTIEHSSGLDRRKFLGTVGLAAGAVIAASVAPLAARAASGCAAPPMVPADATVTDPADELWDVDDMWGNRPRYAHPVPYAHGIPGAGLLERSGPYSVLAREP